MDNPWGLSGPEFLQLYGVGLAVAVVLAFWIRFAARRPDPDARTDSRGLTPVELGYLIGGAERAAETAVAGLLARDVLRASRGGHVSSTGAPALADPVERAAHDYLDGARRPVALLLGRVASSRAVTELGARLADRGLLVPVTRKERTAARSALPLVVLAVIGLVRAVHGGALGFPIGYLVLFLIATGVLAGVVWWLPVCWRTQAGDDLVERLTAQPGTAAADLVARNGFSAYPDPRTKHALLSLSAQSSGARRVAPSRQRGRGRSRGGYTDTGYAAGYGAGIGGFSGGDGGSSGGGGGGCGGGGGGCGGGGGS